MKLILSKRQNGKTTRLIEECSKDNYSLIVCPTRMMCRSVFEQAKKMGKNIPMPITFDEYVNYKWVGTYVDKFYFDELQLSLSMYSRNGNIGSVTIDTSHIDVVTLSDMNCKE